MVGPRRAGQRPGDRGQAHTLEAFTASLLLVGAIVFALQVTAVTPLTASTSSQHIENQQQQIAAGLLDSAASNGSLREAVLYWNDTEGQFHGVNDREGYYAIGGPSGTQFGDMLNRTFRDRGIAMNVNVWFVTATGGVQRERMVHFGTPSDNAVSARRTITVYDDEQLTAPGATETLAESTTFYAADRSPTTGVYAVLRVEVIVWRM